ncbi:hypothetical protein QBC38DRAFT_485356 [Podospora fimiseda]|uniref:Zn(2)-C6 fungal-type domain-containing protein n=1 Tax=Podospora fimiseda TaxID=252190 RepID=A0AAN7BJD0_9PEZI|nr:hypothetical protein QBC38DRAFT_485356 [Podospora fimiseda]
MEAIDPTAPPSTRIRRQRKTCLQCAKSKRKCDQTTPWCNRCMEKGIICTYPPKRTIFAPYNLTSSPLASGPSPAPEAPGPNTSSLSGSVLVTDSSVASSSSERTPDSSLYPSEDSISPYQWFLAPDSWLRQSSNQNVCVHNNLDPDTVVSRESLPHFISKLQQWTRSYATEGHSPLFHRQIYKSFMPDIIKDAYTSRAAYDLALNKDSKAVALRIMEDRVNHLVQSQPDAFISSETDLNHDEPGVPIDTCIHLARTQALFIYQLTRLFDGDIRARAEAETRIDTLHSWARQMMESARIDCMLGQSSQPSIDMTSLCEISNFLATIPHSNSELSNSTFVPLDIWTLESPFEFPVDTCSNNFADMPTSILPHKPPVSIWQLWITSESARRIYLAAEFMLSVYHTIKNGWSVCPGGAMFCAQEGMWDASSQVEWHKAFKNTRGKKNREWVLMQSLGSRRLLNEARPDEIDLFAKGIMDINLGMETVERWYSMEG